MLHRVTIVSPAQPLGDKPRGVGVYVPRKRTVDESFSECLRVALAKVGELPSESTSPARGILVSRR